MAELTRKQKEWSVHLDRQKQSGLSRAEYCKQYGFKLESMTYFAFRLRDKANDEKASGTFLQIPLRMSSPPVVLKLSGGVTLEIPSEPALVTHIIKSLR